MAWARSPLRCTAQDRPFHCASQLPELLLAIICMAAVVWGWELDQQGVKIVRTIPASLPAFQLPEIEWSRVHALTSSSLAIALLGLLEAIAMAKAIAAKTGQKLDINQQCLSEAVGNLTGSFFQCYPGSGSLTRSTINQQWEHRTPMVGRDCRGCRGTHRGPIRAVCLLHSESRFGGHFDDLSMGAPGGPTSVGVWAGANDAIREQPGSGSF